MPIKKGAFTMLENKVKKMGLKLHQGEWMMTEL